MAKTLQELAVEASGWFTRHKRNETDSDNDAIYVLKDGHPDWVKELAHKAHGDMLPDDWRFEFIVGALDALAENPDPDDITMDSDVYTHDLLAWLSSRIDRTSYVDEAVGEYLGDKWPDGGITTAIGWGQIQEKTEVLGLVRSYLEDRLEEVQSEA
jgi:hypothetical protein